MNLAASYKYQLMDHKNSLIVFYCVLIGLFLLTTIFMLFFMTTSTSVVVTDGEETLESYYEGGGRSSVSGMESAAAIFLFIMGLCTFKEPFRMLAQNGISRRTVMVGKLLTMVSVALIMAIMDKVFGLLLTLLSRLTEGNVVYSTLYEILYSGRAQELSGAALQAESFLFSFALYLAAMAAGYFLTVLFYRLPKGGKIAVGVGVPVFLFIVYPLADLFLTGGKVSIFFAQMIYKMFGAALPAIGSFFVVFLLLMACVWLLMRRTVVRA